jgi:type II secretory pathway component PulK
MHISELALLRNVDRTTLAQILPFVCLLPEEDTKVNVNTANLHTLGSLHGSLSPDQVESVVTSTREFASVADFVEAYPGFIPVTSALSVASKYFRLHAYVQVGTSSLTLQSILRRDPASGEVTVLSRDFGKLFKSAVEVATEEAS